MINVVYLDLDGVCANFLGKALSYFNTTPEQLYSPPHAKGVWEVEKLLGITAYKFWQTLPDDIFADLQPLEDGMKVYENLRRSNVLVSVCTSPSNNPRCFMDKANWVKKHMPFAWDEGICIYKNKWELAGEGRLLIDDSDYNCRWFNKMGGQSILFPRDWNSNWEIQYPACMPSARSPAFLYVTEQLHALLNKV